MSDTKGHILCNSFIWNVESRKTNSNRRICGWQELEVREWRVTANGDEVTLWGDENILELDGNDVYTVLGIY